MSWGLRGVSLCFWFSVAQLYPDGGEVRSAGDVSTVAIFWPVNADDNLIALETR